MARRSQLHIIHCCTLQPLCGAPHNGFYSNKSRGMRKKAEVETSAESFSESEENAAAVAVTRCSQTWAMLIKRALSWTCH